MKTQAAFALLALAATACGTAEPVIPVAEQPTSKETRQGPETEAPKAMAKAPASESTWSLKAASPDRLPECTADTEGRLAWVVSEKTAFACSEGAWHPLELKGKDGQSVVGERGEKGDKGDRGEAGQSITGAAGNDGASCAVEDLTNGARVRCGNQAVDILDGAAGSVGSAGPQGTAGTTTILNTSAYPNLKGANGNIIGQVLQWDSAYTSYLVRADSGLRLRVGTTGAHRAYTFGYLTSDCSGDAFVARVPELWEDLVESPAGFKVRHGVPASRTFLSRKNGPTAGCTTQTNSWESYALRAPTSAEQASVWAFGTPFVD